MTDGVTLTATNPGPRLSLRLLGGFALTCDGQRREIAYEKGRALIAFLANEPGQAHSREFLAAMFWPGLSGNAGLANLRQVLRDLRQKLRMDDLAEPALKVERAFLRFDSAAGVEIDATEFSAAAPTCPAAPSSAHCDLCLRQMESVTARYRGPFMAGFTLPGCPEFEDWLASRREALHVRALGRLARLADCYERNGHYQEALPIATRFLKLEPWNEEGLRRAMRLYAHTGQRAAALDLYQRACRVLKNDLGVLPCEETYALAERIHRNEAAAMTRPETVARPTAVPHPVLERRQVTVLYCELTATEVDDPDQAFDLLRDPQARCNAIIQGYAGHLVHVHGGGLLVYFGYPQAHEHAARHAVHTALALTRASLAGIELRVGIHTGIVISGNPAVPDAIGAASGTAIRLRQLAGHREVFISAATQRLVAGYFDCITLGSRQLPGSATPQQMFMVRGESAATHRLEAATALTPLVGRKKELAILRAAWHDASRGQRRVVLLQGEAGVGKSRLVLALNESMRDQAYVVRELRCFPEQSQSPFHPLVALFGFVLGFSPDDSVETMFDKLACHVEAYYAATETDVVPLLAGLLSLPIRAPYAAPASAPQQQREKTLAIVIERLYQLTGSQPVLLIVEDLHWADPSTLELLQQFVTRERKAPMLALFTARPEFALPWPESLVGTLTVNAMGDADVAELVAAVAPDLAPETARRIVERADGIPLFAEELARNAAANDHTAIPSTLQDLLAARLDSMGEAKTVARLAAVVGREFSVDLLRRISPFDDAALLQLLHQLENAGLVRAEAHPFFHFKHALIRDAAYQSQPQAERAAAHRRLAAALRSDGADAQPELLAQHWAAGGAIPEAIACWVEAGKRASRHSASQEAVIHFKSGLALIDALPAGGQRLDTELDLQIGLGAAAIAAQGYASAEGANAYASAIALCSQNNSGPNMFAAVWGLWASASSRVGYVKAQELARQLLRMADQSGEPVQQQQGHFALADTLYWQGEFAVSRRHLERVRALYQSADHERHVAEFGEDAGVAGGAYLSWVLWFSGFPDQARAASTQSLALARRLGHPYSLGYALTFSALLRCRLRQPDEALAIAQELLTLAANHGFALWQIGALLARGWALAMQGRHEGAEAVRQCVEATRAAMGGVTLVVLEPLADANVVLGLHDAALGVTDEAFAVGGALGDHHVEAELHRLKGESLRGLADAHQARAETCFQEALALSRRQQAKSLELRAAMSLARLWQAQGKKDDARQLLEAVYNWFTEGFDTPDLRDARELLASSGDSP